MPFLTDILFVLREQLLKSGALKEKISGIFLNPPMEATYPYLLISPKEHKALAHKSVLTFNICAWSLQKGISEIQEICNLVRGVCNTPEGFYVEKGQQHVVLRETGHRFERTSGRALKVLISYQGLAKKLSTATA